MYKAREIAKYFLNKDENKMLFNLNDLIAKNGRKFYSGNARLNKYLHITQNLFIAKTGEKLFEDDLLAYDNGAIVLDVQENYSMLLRNKTNINIDDETKLFLDKIYKALENATVYELIEISHEDDAWQERKDFYSKNNQIMNSMEYKDKYKEQYKDMLYVLENIQL